MTGKIKSLICEERENDTFPFPWSEKSCLDFLRLYKVDGFAESHQRAPGRAPKSMTGHHNRTHMGARIRDRLSMSLIREKIENHAFHFS
jgi:hypothetical protein